MAATLEGKPGRASETVTSLTDEELLLLGIDASIEVDTPEVAPKG